jgi:hypothetical protein
VMYDRQTESWWQQATGEAIVGELTGTRLEFVAQTTLAWKTARETYPNLQVLSRETGYDRPYGRNPYVGYDRRDGSPIRRFFRRDTDPRLPAMERVAAVEIGDGWAVGFEVLKRERVVNDAKDGTPFGGFGAGGAAWGVPDSASPEGRDVGQTAVYDRRVSGRTLTFRAAEDGFEDRETGSRWDLAGRAVAGSLQGQRLRPVPHGNHFWFAWVVFRPDTELRQP